MQKIFFVMKHTSIHVDHVDNLNKNKKHESCKIFKLMMFVQASWNFVTHNKYKLFDNILVYILVHVPVFTELYIYILVHSVG